MMKLAAAQHGVIDECQLRALGLSAKAVTRRVRDGLLTPLFAGTYAVGAWIPTRRGLWLAATRSAGDGAVLVSRSAAQLQRIAGLIPGPPHVAVPHRRKLERPGIVIQRTRSLPDSQVTIRHGIPVTTVERTLLDFAAVASPGELRDAVRAAERLELLDAPLVADLCERARGRRGSARLRAMLEIPRGPITEVRSPLEDLFLPICADFGIRFPAVNVPVLDYVVDCLWLPERLVVELDGYEWHKSRESFESDRRRDIKLGAAGYPVLRLTDRRMRAERADAAADVARMLEQLASLHDEPAA